MIPARSATVELVSPFPRDLYNFAREWFMQYPERMLDDYWPKDFAGQTAELDRRTSTECTYAVIENGVPVGFIGYMRLSSLVGSLRGVCFDKKVHGNGTALRALRTVLQEQFDLGVHKIMAFPFADNQRSYAFYKKLGAVDEGFLKEHTMRGGKLTDMHMLAFFAPHDGYRHNL